MQTHFWYSIFILLTVFDANHAKAAESDLLKEDLTDLDEVDFIQSPPNIDLTDVLKSEGGLIHNMFKLLRLEISVLNQIEQRLQTRMKRAKKSSHSDRFNDIQNFVDDTKVYIASQIKVIKGARKLWSATKASTGGCQAIKNMLALIEVHPKVTDQILSNGDVLENVKSRLVAEKSSLHSRKLRFAQIIADAPQRFADLEIARGSLDKDAGAISLQFRSLKNDLVESGKACASDEQEASVASIDEDADIEG